MNLDHYRWLWSMLKVHDVDLRLNFQNALPRQPHCFFLLMFVLWTTIKRLCASLPFLVHIFTFFPHTLGNFSPRSFNVRSQTMVLWIHIKNIQNCARATILEGSISNFQWLISVNIPTRLLSRIFNIRDLRSGKFYDLTLGETIISQWRNVF